MTFRHQKNFSSLVHDINVCHRCRKLVLKRYLHKSNKQFRQILKESGSRLENSGLRIKIACIYSLHESFVMILYHSQDKPFRISSA